MEAYLLEQILKKLSEGSVAEFLVYLLIYVFIWLEVRGMKKELKNINTTVNGSLLSGEKRFESIENKQFSFEHRVTELENFLNQTHDRIYYIETKLQKGD